MTDFIVTYKLKGIKGTYHGGIWDIEPKHRNLSAVLEDIAATCVESYFNDGDLDINSVPESIDLELFFNGESKGCFDVEIGISVSCEAYKTNY